jgi:predicted NBD/HSP70 family sugar kinase
MKDVGLDSVFLENNAQALTMAEKTFGAGRQSNSFVLLEVEAGVGGGIVCNGELYSGWRGFGNELGHTSIDMNGPLCSCGLRGCVEMYASVPKMLAKAQKLAKARKKVPRIHDWRSFMDRVAAGDSPCRDLLKEQARALGTAIVNVINVLELDAVVLTGDVLYRGEILRLDIERILNQTAINRWLRHIPVYLSPLGERPELMAAAGIPAEKFFQGQVEPAMVRQGNVKQKDLEDER